MCDSRTYYLLPQAIERKRVIIKYVLKLLQPMWARFTKGTLQS